MADYLADFYPEWVDKEENPRQVILDLGKMITNRIPVKLGFQKLNKYDPEYWGLAMLLTDEQAEVALKMGVRKPKTMADMVKLTGKTEEELEKILGSVERCHYSNRRWFTLLFCKRQELRIQRPCLLVLSIQFLPHP